MLHSKLSYIQHGCRYIEMHTWCPGGCQATNDAEVCCELRDFSLIYFYKLMEIAMSGRSWETNNVLRPIKAETSIKAVNRKRMLSLIHEMA